jgi:hypothetical protein
VVGLCQPPASGVFDTFETAVYRGVLVLSLVENPTVSGG